MKAPSRSSTTGATVNVLFGSIFTLPPGITTVMAVLGVASLALIAVLYRPLLLSSVSDELAAARRVPVRLVGAGYLLALALAVSMSAVTIGAILSTALLIGPAAIALRVASRTGVAFAVAVAVGVFACWAGTLIAYDSTDLGGRDMAGRSASASWPSSSSCTSPSAIVSRLRTDRRRSPPAIRPRLIEPVEVD